MACSVEQVAKAPLSLIESIQGDPERLLYAARPLSDPKAGAISYVKVSFDNKALTNIVSQLHGLAIICSSEHAQILSNDKISCLVTDNPRLAFIRAIEGFFSKPKPSAGIHPSAVVDPTATIDPTASVGAGCFVGTNSVIGARTVLQPNVTILDDVRVGADVLIGAGTVIGGDGFGFERNEEFELEKFPHIGGVKIEDNVEIGTNTSIDRGTLGDTIIEFGARIDNQCHISHNVRIGKHCAVIAQSMLGGSARIANYAWLAPASIVMNQASVGKKATVGLGAVVVKDVPAEYTVMGAPAVPADEFRRQRVALKRLLD